MARSERLLARLLRGQSDANIPFRELRRLLEGLGFSCRVRGDHHIFTHDGVNMVKYETIIYWSREDEAFIAEVPELPGCATDGRTYQEALDNVHVVIREWIETAKELGREIPEPKRG